MLTAKKKKRHVLVSGSLAFDRIMNFGGRFEDHILPEKLHVLNVSFHVRTFRMSYGGTAGNIAYNLALLGESPRTLATFGNDFAPYASWLRTHSVDLSASRRITALPTASAYIITDQRDNQITGFFSGAMDRTNGPIPQQRLKSAALGIVAPGNLADMRRYPASFRSAKVPYIYDPGQQTVVLSKSDLLRGLTGAHTFISNDYELSLVMKKTGLSLPAVLKRVKYVATTRGENGSFIRTGNERYVIPPAKPKNESDPTGAGDAYRAGYAKGILAGYPMPVVGRLAAVVSVYTVEKYGTQTHRFTWADIRKRYWQNFQDRI
ncbi:MAG: carbohydrate kinase family protein [Patescibacteria group bacterium]